MILDCDNLMIIELISPNKQNWKPTFVIVQNLFFLRLIKQGLIEKQWAMISIPPRVTSKPNPLGSIIRKGNSHVFKTEKLDKANIEVLFFVWRLTL